MRKSLETSQVSQPSAVNRTIARKYDETGVCEPPFQQKPFVSPGASHLVDWFDI